MWAFPWLVLILAVVLAMGWLGSARPLMTGSEADSTLAAVDPSNGERFDLPQVVGSVLVAALLAHRTHRTAAARLPTQSTSQDQTASPTRVPPPEPG
jgi:hypothetical protein